jgi:threonine dehydrogenase-like Zn-dependent dehydrogenase
MTSDLAAWRGPLPAPSRIDALVKDGASVALSRVPCPELALPDDVLVRVAYAGICRTDLAVADGAIARRASPVVLGHELSGHVVAMGPRARGVAMGDPVSVVPQVACGRCAGCKGEGGCLSPETLGIDRDGAFAEIVRVPASAIVRLPRGLAMRSGAYVEPVAAALAVVEAGISIEERGLVLGAGRIAGLTLDVLRARGFTRVEQHDPRVDSAPARDAFDFAVETEAKDDVLAIAIDAVAPRGRIILKSRATAPVAIDVGRVVAKRLTLEGALYGSFDEAVRLLASGSLDLDALLGPARPLACFASVLEGARRDERRKLFFAISGPPIASEVEG